MSVIQQILTEISGFIEGPDHSNSPRFRSLAESYADACSIVHADLEECRKLIENGLAAEALYKNNHAQPALTERARMLLFPGREKWVELCVMYQAAIPVKFDMELIKKLESGEFGKVVESSADMQAQWRILARTGTNHEKILLLRRLLKADSTTPIWHRNLETVERAWIIELQQSAQKAQKIGDLAHLHEVYELMMSPELLHPVPHSILDPFMDDIRKYEKDEMQRKQEQAVQKVSAAYDMADLDKLQAALEEWTKLTGEPLYSAQELQEAQIREATSFLTEKRMRQDAEARAEELCARLHSQLDDARIPFSTVSRTFYELQRISQVAMDPDLEARFRGAEERYNIDQHRKYVRALVIGVLASIFAAIGISFLIHKLQTDRQTESICAEMQALIEKGDPEDAIQFYENLQKKDPDAAGRDAVIARKQEAVRRADQKQEEQTAYAGILRSLEAQLTEEKAELPETLELFNAAENFAGYHTEEQNVQMMNLRTRHQEILHVLQDRRDTAFRIASDKLRQELFKLDTMLNEKDTVDTSAVEHRLLKEQGKIQELFSGSGKISKELQTQEKEAFERQQKQIRTRIASTEAYRKTVRLLNEPKSIQEYLTGLTDAPMKAPSKFNEFRAAEPQVRFLQNREKLAALLAASADSPELAKDGFNLVQNSDPWCHDVRFLMPNPDTFSQIMKKLQDLKTLELPEWKLYELELSFGGKSCYFYLKNKNDLEVERAGGRLGGEYRSITFKTEDGNVWLMSVKRIPNTDEYELEIVKSGAAMQQRRTDKVTAKRMAEIAARKIPQASHYTLISSTLKKLLAVKNIPQLEKALYDEVLNYTEASGINPAAKVEIVSRLLNLYGNISEFDSEIVKRIRRELGISGWKNGSWKTPGSVEPSVLAKAGTYFKSEAFDSLCRNAELTRRIYRNAAALKLLPAGVLYRRGDKLVCLFFADRIKSEEYVVFLKNSPASMGCYVLPAALTGTGSMALSQLPPELSLIRHGEIFYASQTRTGLRVQIMPENKDGAVPFQLPEMLPVNDKNRNSSAGDQKK